MTLSNYQELKNPSVTGTCLHLQPFPLPVLCIALYTNDSLCHVIFSLLDLLP